MSAHIEIQPENEHDKRLNGPQTARGRLYEWARVRHWEPPNAFPASPFARIAEMQDFAAARGVGIKYDMVQEEGDTEAVACKPDGGMVNMCARLENVPHSHAMRMRCRETQAAIDVMPKAYRLVVRSMYEVERLERPKQIAGAAEKAQMEETTFRKTMDLALAWLQGRLDLDQLRADGDSGVDGC